MIAPRSLAVATQADVERARSLARDLGMEVGFDRAVAEVVVLAVSELATNLVRYARCGVIVLSRLERAGEFGSRTQRGLQIESRDVGPGIANLTEALRDGFSTGGGLGSGLPGVRRLMDEFEIASHPQGTTIVARKWLVDR